MPWGGVGGGGRSPCGGRLGLRARHRERILRHGCPPRPFRRHGWARWERGQLPCGTVARSQGALARGGGQAHIAHGVPLRCLVRLGRVWMSELWTPLHPMLHYLSGVLARRFASECLRLAPSELQGVSCAERGFAHIKDPLRRCWLKRQLRVVRQATPLQWVRVPPKSAGQEVRMLCSGLARVAGGLGKDHVGLVGCGSVVASYSCEALALVRFRGASGRRAGLRSLVAQRIGRRAACSACCLVRTAGCARRMRSCARGPRTEVHGSPSECASYSGLRS